MTYAILLGAILAGVYALSYYLNHKTPVPKGCENLEHECEGCHIVSCAKHSSHRIVEQGEK